MRETISRPRETNSIKVSSRSLQLFHSSNEHHARGADLETIHEFEASGATNGQKCQLQ